LALQVAPGTSGKSEIAPFDGMKVGEGVDGDFTQPAQRAGVVQRVRSLVLDDESINALHDVEGGAKDRRVLASQNRPRHWYRRVLKRSEE
jgi:hypothetical protein